jgi:hypothetical protein
VIVRLQGDISGTRDGRPWPPRGSRIDLPDLEAMDLCRSGMAIPVAGDAEVVETAVVPVDDVETREALTTDTGPARKSRR